MKGIKLQKKGRSRCILFMAGWSMGPEPFRNCIFPESDLFLCYDYRDLSLPDLSWLPEYEQVDLLAWSMGVWVAAVTLAHIQDCFTSATALAGTLYPIDDRRGIPVAAYEKMEHSLTATDLENFHLSMFDNPEEAQRFLRNRPNRSLASVQEELHCLHHHIHVHGPKVQNIFNHGIVTTRDRIFPPRNQIRAWRKQCPKQKKWPHFFFYRGDFQSFLQCAHVSL